MKMEMFFSHTVMPKSSKNIYPMWIGVAEQKASDLVHEPFYVWGLCRTGCKNFGHSGGCPPRSPDLWSIANPNDKILLVCSIFESGYKTPKVQASTNPAVHWKFQDAITARFMNNTGWTLATASQGSFLATGYCMGCPGQKCAFKLGQGCRNPQKRTFSMESTGINVVQTVKNIFDADMHWYKPKTTNIPYMLKCIAVFPDKNFVLPTDAKTWVQNLL